MDKRSQNMLFDFEEGDGNKRRLRRFLNFFFKFEWRSILSEDGFVSGRGTFSIPEDDCSELVVRYILDRLGANLVSNISSHEIWYFPQFSEAGVIAEHRGVFVSDRMQIFGSSHLFLLQNWIRQLMWRHICCHKSRAETHVKTVFRLILLNLLSSLLSQILVTVYTLAVGLSGPCCHDATRERSCVGDNCRYFCV